MTSPAESVAGVLLAEHDGLSELLRLLKAEQQLVLQRRSEALISLMTVIEGQLLRVRNQQSQRNDVLKSLLADTPISAQPGVAARVALLPELTREQTLPIAERIDTLMLLVHELAWQNHVLLSHSVHFLEEVLAPWLGTEKQTTTLYNQDGLIRKGTKRPTLFHAVA